MMNKNNEMLRRFIEDTKDHSIDIQKDDGVFRHIRFSKGGSSNMCFFLTTWPGHLCFSGDMGTYVFRRLDDMFEFFRGDELSINVGYWTEKLESISCFGSEEGRVTQFDIDTTVKELRNYLFDDLSEDEMKKYNEMFENLEAACDDKEALEIMYRGGIEDAWEHLYTKPTFHIKWCLYAIRWGIQIYDKTKGDRKL